MQMPKPKLIEVSGTEVQLPDGGPAVEPTIRQRCVTRYNGFADLDSLFDAPPISHEIDVTISRWVLETEEGDPWSWLAAAFEPESSDGEEWVTIASAQVDELPARFRWDLNTTWFDWLDSMDDDLAVVGEFADDLTERDDCMALLSGSLLYVRKVEVHPAFYGQQIGARLVAHSLWSLSRSDGDVAMLLAKPMKGRFHPEKPDCSAAAIRRLAGYYRRMGFVRSRPRERFRDDGPVLMHALIGEFTLPFRGLGGMGKDE
jgi:GNAT superfamily N-acetyltransferase